MGREYQIDLEDEAHLLRAKLAKYEAAGKGLLPDCEPVAGAGVCAAFQFARAALGKVGAEIAEADARANMLAANIEHWKDLAERAVAELAEAKASIAELEIMNTFTISLNKQLQDAQQKSDARAERAEAELKVMREALQQLVTDYEDVPGPYDAEGQAVFAKARAALAPSPAGPDGKSLAVIYCMERAEEDVKLLREALEGLLEEWDRLTRYGSPMAKAANPRVAKARAALAPSPAGREG